MSFAPLAARMRPQSWDDIVGHAHLVAPKGILRELVESHKIPSFILWGPPGVGKTTLAEIVCKASQGEFIKISAVLAGVKEIREAVLHAEKVQKAFARHTFVFIDEIHRFNKAQQDALLPHVENGTITLLGATTENPSFSVNSPLLSRCRVFVLQPLEPKEVDALLEKGAKELQAHLSSEAKEQLIANASGDGRIALTLLEIAHDLARMANTDTIEAQQVIQAAGRRSVSYDKAGDIHYDVISAFIKSMRGSDPDATCHYLARMIEGGEDPRFILRRMIIFASEDIGNADPQAIQVAVAALHAFELVGLPEGTLALTQAALYLACAPKSNATYVARNKAIEDIKHNGDLPIPLHLCNAPTQMMKNLGYGKGYQYPHDYPENYVPVHYLPDNLQGITYYTPTENGYERFIKERMINRKKRLKDGK